MTKDETIKQNNNNNNIPLIMNTNLTTSKYSECINVCEHSMLGKR